MGLEVESNAWFGDEEDPFYDITEEDAAWAPEPESFVDFMEFEEKRRRLEGILQVSPSQFTETAFRMPNAEGDGWENFSFNGRRHMRRIYDTPARRVLLTCARQVEKTLTLSSSISKSDGSTVLAGDVEVGMSLATLDVPDGGSKMSANEVTWVSKRYFKPCVRLVTRQGHSVDVATTHPMRIWNGWKEAGEISVGDRIAAVRRCGQFTGEIKLSRDRLALTAYLLGDGHMSDYISFTSLPGAKLNEFMKALSNTGTTFRIQPKQGTKALAVRLHKNGKIWEWLCEDGLLDIRSKSKFIPEWAFKLSRQSTAFFLNRLWSTDGHVKRNARSKYSIEYCSISEELVRDVQRLLWKFGIPSRIRKNWSNIYKKRGQRRFAYILRVETQEGVRTFLQKVGALDKSEGIDLPDSLSNNNRDTYPKEINEWIRRIVDSKKENKSGDRSLRSAGLRYTLGYPLTKDKLAIYLAFFRRDDGYDQELVDALEKHLDTDVYWDSVVKVIPLGKKECIDFEVQNTHNFVANGLITHNSTLLGNTAICYSCLISGFKTLYVSPTSTQTKTFSNDRLREPLETSDILRGFTTKMLSQNIFEKQFVNWSKITLRNAFLNADRTRGIPSWMLLLDEFQDLLSDNVPIIEQCTSHAPEKWKRFIYAGTPKSLDNNLEYYRAHLSTQGEWAVPCDHCGSTSTGRYWNILGEKNIEKKGLSCERCHGLINPQHEDAQWVSMVKYDPDETPFESYRIPQLMVPWKPWDEILLDYHRYPRDRFYNECLGLSFDSGMRPLTLAQVKACCNPRLSMHPSFLKRIKKALGDTPVFAGADWGTGENSYTVVCLGAYFGTVFRIFYIHRCVGTELDPPVQLAFLTELFQEWNVQIIGSDYGGGFHNNDHLIRQFGPMRMAKFQYLARNKRKVDWDPKLRRFKVHRTEVMSDIFNAIKRGNVFEFPRWEEFKDPYAQDMCNIFSEYNEMLRMTQYDHGKDRPDDSFHSILYCVLASMIKFARPDIITPLRQDQNRGPIFAGYTGPQWQG